MPDLREQPGLGRMSVMVKLRKRLEVGSLHLEEPGVLSRAREELRGKEVSLDQQTVQLEDQVGGRAAINPCPASREARCRCGGEWKGSGFGEAKTEVEREILGDRWCGDHRHIQHPRAALAGKPRFRVVTTISTPLRRGRISTAGMSL